MLILSKDKILKKSAFGGFKKEDVLDYIEKLQQEIVELKREAADCAAYKRDVDRIKASEAETEKKVVSLLEQKDALTAENSALVEKNASLTLKLEQLTSILEKSKADAAEAEEKYNILAAEYSRVTDIKSMTDEAKESVSNIASDARNAVDSVYADVSSASNRFRTVTVNFESSLASLKSGTEALLTALSSASENLGSLGKKD